MPSIMEKPRIKRGMNPKSLANLHPFKAGNNANPKGRPTKDCSLTSLVKSLIDTIPPGEKQGRTWRQLLALAWLMGAMKNPVLLKELLDRLEGRPKESLDITTKGKAIDGHKDIPDQSYRDALVILASSNICQN